MKNYITNSFLVLFSILGIFVMGELLVQMYLDPSSGTNKSFERILKKSMEDNLTISNYAKRNGFSRILGADNALTKIINNDGAIKNLIIGDSVTGGHGLTDGNYSYAELLAQKKSLESTHIWHIDGGGIDQLYLKVLSEAQFLNYDKINISFIAHDVLRAGTRYIYSSTKVKFQFGNNNEIKIILAEDLENFYNSYIKAKNNFYLSLWYVKKYYMSKEYFFPNFFPKYYKKLFEYIVKELNHIAEKKNIEINLIMLPNSYDFKGIKVINESYKNIINKKFTKLKIYDLNKCAKEQSKKNNVNFYKEFHFHPNTIGHKIIADCFSKLVF